MAYSLQSVEQRAIYPPKLLNGKPVLNSKGKPEQVRVAWYVATLRHISGGLTTVSCRKRKGKLLYHVVSVGFPKGKSFVAGEFARWANGKLGHRLATQLLLKLAGG